MKNFFKKLRYSEPFELILLIFKVTFFAIGGASSIFYILRQTAVYEKKWLSEKRFDRVFAIATLIPGSTGLQILYYICYRKLSLWKSLVVFMIAIIPHALLTSLLLYLFAILPETYLFVIVVSITPIVIANLILIIIRYFKVAQKEMVLPKIMGLFLFTFAFSFFVPVPYNFPLIPIFLILLYIIVWELYKHWKTKRGKNP